ncbi:MAG TPA: hypothetical protein VKT82_03605 [Ktedonobacterales bacterium]|nr:hypothetical protein [Ktedonobacterales bacterium]
MRRWLVCLVLLVTMLGVVSCDFITIDSPAPTPTLTPLGDAAFVLIDLIRNRDDIFTVASDTVLLAQDAFKLFASIPANQSPPANTQRGYIQVSIHYNKQGVDTQDIYRVKAGKASLGILFEGGKTFETFSANSINIDATQTQEITIVPLQNAVNYVTVSAGRGWQDTKVFLERGKKFEVKYVSGVWTSDTGSVGTSDAAGQPLNPPPNLICRCGEPLEGYSTQALIGRIGNGLGFAPLQVGDDYVGKAYDDDFLYLRMNLPDQRLPQSSGSLKIAILTYNA